MSIPYIPAIDPTVASSLASLGESVAAIARPTLSYDLALRQQLAEHPEMIQQLANLGARNPGMLQRFIGPNAARAIRGVQQSPEDAASQAKGILDTNVATRQNKGINNSPQAEPAAITGGISQLSGGRSPADISAGGLANTANQAAAALPTNPSDLTYNTSDGGSKKYSPMVAAEDFLNGKLPADVNAAITRNPLYAPSFNDALQDLTRRRAQAAEYSRATLFAGTHTEFTPAEAAKLASANGLDANAVLRYFGGNDANYVALADRLANNPGTAQTADDKAAEAVGRFAIGQGQARLSKQAAPAMAVIQAQSKVLNDDKENFAARRAAADRINLELGKIAQERGDTTIPQVSFEGRLGTQLFGRPVYRDAKGNTVESSAFQSLITSMAGGGNTQSSNAPTTPAPKTPQPKAKTNELTPDALAQKVNAGEVTDAAAQEWLTKHKVPQEFIDKYNSLRKK